MRGWILHIAGLIFTIPAILANIEIGLDAGRGWAFVSAGVVMVIAAAVCGVALVKSLQTKAFSISALAFVLLACFTLMNVLNALGLASHDRSERRNVALSARENVQRLDEEKSRLEGLIREGLKASKGQPSRTVQSVIDAKKLQPFFARSENCKDVTIDDSREQCSELFALEAQHRAALDVEGHREKLATVAEGLRNVSTPDAIDPQAENILAIASLALSIRSDAVKETGIALNAWWAICIELLAAFMPGLVVFLGGHAVGNQSRQKATRQDRAKDTPATKPAPNQDAIAQWAGDRIITGRGAVGFSFLLENCNAWMSENGFPPVSDTLLGRRLGEMGFKKEKIDGKMHYVGIRINAGKAALSVVK
jgi:hypothetical protein